MSVTKDTRLTDILKEYPWLKAELLKKYPAFKALDNPLGMAFIRKSTIADLAKKAGKSPDELIDNLNKEIEERNE